MENSQVEQQPTERTESTIVTPESGTSVAGSTQADLKPRQPNELKTKKTGTKGKCKAKSRMEMKDKKKSKKEASDSESSESDPEIEATSDSSSSDSDSESEDERKKRKSKSKKIKSRRNDRKRKSKKNSRRKSISSSESDSSSDSHSSDSEQDEGRDVIDDPEIIDENEEILRLVANLQEQQLDSIPPPVNTLTYGGLNTRLANPTLARLQSLVTNRRSRPDKSPRRSRNRDRRGSNAKKHGKRGSRLDFKRVDELWDSEIHNYKLRDTIEDEESSEYDQYVFNVRRRFDWEGKYTSTVLDIKSPLIKEALNTVMDGVKGVSLVEDTPTIDPNMAFLYLEELRQAMKDLKAKIKSGEKMKRKVRRRNQTKLQHMKVLISYLDKDYASIKKTLYPMLESGLITFDLLWALFKPNTLIYTTTYGSPDEPRAFKCEYAEKEFSYMRGEWYSIEGRYLEYDGKTWGMGSMDCDIPSFKGARKITGLACYPLKYHKEEAKIREQLIERGKKFVSLQGVHFKAHEGLAYYKKKRQVVKVNSNSRMMIDPASHRRLWPNYNVSTVKPKEDGDASDGESDCCCCCSDDDSDAGEGGSDGEEKERTKLKVILDEKKKPIVVRVRVDEDGNEIKEEKLEEIQSKDEDKATEGKENEIPTFSEEEYLIASPVLLGFSFGEKLWLEFTVSGIKEITWNASAYESLVIEPSTKEIVKALVQSHKYHATKSIDDVIQGKGKGLVAVLHGPPGTGKTLTAEGIGELLKCPVYMVSAGELGTDPRTLEGELQRILDIAHAWGAVLLLDEADVFLEKRTIQDIHRNALVSIFLRLLEYFQGILFLTTNRVETFDDAFQSRIHIALRYGELTIKAKRSVFKQFIERVRVQEGLESMPFSEDDYSLLARHNLNGRQIKNTVRTAQALALNKGESLSMDHIKAVLDVHMNFERDLKGGPGFEDAMRGYF